MLWALPPILMLGVGCGSAERPNLLMIVSDSLRADALSCYGGRAHTPRICELAARGALFENAYSNASWTLPSSVSLFTGSHSSVYARSRGGRSELPEEFFYVPDEELLLAEALRDQGYDVMALLENPIAAEANTLQGFRLPDSEGYLAGKQMGRIERLIGADTSDGRYQRFLAAVQYILELPDRNFFLLKWIQDAHALYDPPEKFLSDLGVYLLRLPKPLAFYTGLGHHDDPRRGLHKLKHVAASLNEAERQLVETLYLKEVESVDERVGYLIDALRRKGLEQNTLVVFTSDHGEGFAEHGKFLHGNSYFDELLRIPLIMAGPGVAKGVRIEAAVSHVDLMPTLCEVMRVVCLPDAQGSSFAGLLGGGPPPEAEGSVYVVGIQRTKNVDALVEGRYKLIVRKDELSPRLFDLEEDPGETSDLAASRPEAVARLIARIEAIRRDDSARRARQLDRGSPSDLERVGEDTRRQLEALGYVD